MSCRTLVSVLARVLVAIGLVTAFAVPASAATGPLFSVLHDFSAQDGRTPNSPLIRGADGLYYGTLGGNLDGIDRGGVFRMDGAGNVATVHVFTGADGDDPVGLLRAADGTIFGVTARGGTGTNPNCVFVGGCGSVFRLGADGSVATLHSFDGGYYDGNWPNGAIAEGTDGSLYGTTFQGGTENFGIAYRLSRAGQFTLLHQFTRADGINPQGGLIRASDANFYGVTNQYGPAGGGTVFRLSPAGAVTVIHAFGFGDGYQPKARLLQASDGFLYGTTEGGGASGAGVVFRVRLDGSGFSVLHAFDQWGSDGYRPTGGLVQGPDGSFYGTTPIDGLPVYGPDRRGVVYRMSSTGVVSVLHTFTGPDGHAPSTSMLVAGDGALVGTTPVGGSAGNGVVFRVNPTAPLPVASVSVSPNPLVQGTTGTGTVTLTVAAPSGGTVVDLSTNNEGAAQVPRTVTVPGGRFSASFPVSTQYPISAQASLLVFASVGGSGISAPLAVLPSGSGSGPGVQALTITPSTVHGGASAQGTVTLSGPAPSAGVSVALRSDHPRKARVPASITVPSGATSGSFTISTRRVASTIVATITATVNGTQARSRLTVTP